MDWEVGPIVGSIKWELSLSHIVVKIGKRNAHSEKKDKNKCPFLKWWDLFFAKKARFLHCDANAAKHQIHFFGATA